MLKDVRFTFLKKIIKFYILNDLFTYELSKKKKLVGKAQFGPMKANW